MIMLQAVHANFQEVQKVLSGSGSEEDNSEVCIEADVYESLQCASVGVQVQVRVCGCGLVQV
jgi:hypothetical protein